MTHRNTWKQRERQVARFHGAERQPLSGSSGRSDQTQSDSTHERLFIETKLRESTAIRSLYDKTAKAAKRENKIPIVATVDKGKPGHLITVHSDYLAAFCLEHLRGSRMEGTTSDNGT